MELQSPPHLLTPYLQRAPGKPLCSPRCVSPVPCSAGVLLILVPCFSSTFGSSGGSVIGQLFSCEMENCSMCRCGKETVRVSSTLLFTLSYPESTGNTQGRGVMLPRGWGCYPYG